MAKAKKKENVTPEERLQAALVSDWEQPYKLPDNWCWTYLTKGPAECLDSFRKPISASERAKREGDIPYYGATGQIGWIDDFLTNEQLVLVGEDGAPFFDLVKDKAYLIEGKAWVNNHAHILRSRFGKVGNIFLMHYLNIFNYHGFVNGTTRLKLTQRSMDTIPVPLPPLSEQQRIVDRIESLYTKLDAAKQRVQDVLDSCEIRKSAILHKAFTGELTARWRQEHGVEMKSWVHCKLIDILVEKPRNGYSPKPVDYTTPYKSMTLSATSTGIFKPEFFKYIDQEIPEDSYLWLKPGDILIQRANSLEKVGMSAIYTGKEHEFIYPDLMMKLVLKEINNKKYVDYYLKSDRVLNYFRSNATGTAGNMPKINQKVVSETPLILPKKLEQNEIVRILDGMFAKEQQVKEAAETVLKQINLIKKSILSRAFCGELGTNDSDEESVIELLKQILVEDSHVKVKKRNKSIPVELKSKLETELERKIIQLYYQRDTESLSSEEIISVSAKKFEIIESL